jgi:phospholipase C
VNRTRLAASLALTLFASLATLGHIPSSTAMSTAQLSGFDPGAKIDHVVVILKENHSFNSVLGPFCSRLQRCRGDDIGTLEPTSTGSVSLAKAPDIVPVTDHSHRAQQVAWNHGSNDHWNLISGCSAATGYACYQAYAPDQIPNTIALAENFALSDNTFTCQRQASWSDKLTWGSACDQNGFRGDNPQPAPGVPLGRGWGCLSNRVTPWSGDGGATYSEQPSCVPDYSTGLDFGGAFRETPVPEQVSLFENCDLIAPCTWVDYNTSKVWSPTDMRAYTVFENPHEKTPGDFITAATNGTLPSISFVTSSLSGANDSQHNGDSMLIGDNSIQREVSAVMNGPDWSSTAIFITWDDCGCQYDPIAPNRVPMIIVSPYARAGYTDTRKTTFAGVVRFIEETFGLPNMNAHDLRRYDFRNAFDFSQAPLAAARLHRSHVSAASRRATLANPLNESDDS